MLLKRFFFGVILLMCACSSTWAAQSISPVDTVVLTRQKPVAGTFFSGDFDFEITEEVLDVLQRGISLHFILQVEVEKKRWYWFDREVMSAQENIRLSFNPLMRTYKVSIGGMTQSFDSLAGALAMMKTVTNLHLGPYREMTPEDYEAKARYFLDTSKLPKPFQVTLRKEHGWDLTTGWFPVKITAAEN